MEHRGSTASRRGRGAAVLVLGVELVVVATVLSACGLAGANHGSPTASESQTTPAAGKAAYEASTPFDPTLLIRGQAPSPGWTKGTQELWSITATQLSIAPDDASALVTTTANGVDTVTLYDITPAGLTNPREVGRVDNGGTPGEGAWKSMSVSDTWWGTQALVANQQCDRYTGACTPVPWDASAMTYVETINNDSALLIEHSPSLEASAGALVAVDHTGTVLWRTEGPFIGGFVTPWTSRAVVGYIRTESSPAQFIPVIVNSTNGTEVARLNPIPGFGNWNPSGLIAATDGLVTFDDHQYTAYSPDGAVQWTAPASWKDLSFSGNPTLAVIQNGLNADALIALIAQNSSGIVLNPGDGALQRLGSASPPFALDDRNLLLADASASFTSGDSGKTTLVDLETGTILWSLDGSIVNAHAEHRALSAPLVRSGVWKNVDDGPTGRADRLVIRSADGVMHVYAPAS